VIVQADDLLALSTVVICPTSRSAFPASFHPEITLNGHTTQILCEMIAAVDTRALGTRVGHLTFDEQRSLEEALQLVIERDVENRVAEAVRELVDIATDNDVTVPGSIEEARWLTPWAAPAAFTRCWSLSIVIRPSQRRPTPSHGQGRC
jgi:mRNA interferase MazF